MTAEGHIIFAISNVILIKKILYNTSFTYDTWFYTLLGSILVCLLPDVDHHNSIINRKLKWLSKLFTFLFRHRGFTHSLFAIVVFIFFLKFFLLSIMSLDLFYGMIIGYISHIIADMLTPLGIQFFWPYHHRFNLPLLVIKKKKMERIFCIASLIFAIQYPQ